MKQSEFDTLVARLEGAARTDPRGYRVRVFLLAILGYAYIGAVVAAMVGLLASIAWMLVSYRTGTLLLAKLALPIGTLIFIAARAMWVRLDPPSGRPLARADAPRLFEEADRIAAALDAPRPDVVLVTNELNASVSQVPRFGVFGWRRNYLVIGLQLMSALHPDYFRAVLAHEFAHLSRAHGHFSGWIYRLRMTWVQLLQMLERDQHVGRVIFEPFFRWYAPYFAAYSFVLARAYEYEADRLAAAVAGPRDMAGALIALAVKHRELDDMYWRDLWKAAETEPRPPARAVSDAMTRAAARPDEERFGFWAYSALHEPTDTADTHPSLRERVTALLAAEASTADEEPWIRLLRLAFERPTPPEDPPVRAAPLYLGPVLPRLASEMDAEWQRTVAENWSARHAYCQRARQQLEQLDRHAAGSALSPEDAWQRAELTTEFRGVEQAEPLYRELVERAPLHAGARFALGNILLNRGDASGVEQIERAMTIDPAFVLPGAQVVANYFTLSGRHDEAATYRARMLTRSEELAEADRERILITPRTDFVPATLPPEVVSDLIAQLAAHPDVSQAWLVRQVVKTMVDSPAHVLALTLEGSGLSDKAQEVRGQTITSALTLPDGVNAFVLLEAHADLRRRIAGVENARVYMRAAEAPARKPARARAFLS